MLEIRPMVYEDAAAVHEIDKACFTDAWNLASFQDIFKFKDNYYLLALWNGAIIGFAGILVVIDEADLINIAVLPDFQGKGVGKQLLKKIMELAKEKGVKAMTLEVRESNIKARKLYESFGFTEIFVRKQYYSSPVEDAVIMRGTL